MQVCSGGRREESQLQEAAGAGVEVQDGGGNPEGHRRLVQGCWNYELMSGGIVMEIGLDCNKLNLTGK